MRSILKKIVRRLFRNDRRALEGLDSEHAELITSVIRDRLTYLSAAKLRSIVETCLQIEASGLRGLFIEAGCALGGSTVVIGKLKNSASELRVYDVFGMIPAPTESDGKDVQKRYERIAAGKSRGIGGDRYYGYEENLVDTVKANLARYGISVSTDNVKLIRGLLQDTMEIDHPVVFAHIDVDWYEPVRTCLERLVPNLAAGGVIILDDYHDWSGCRRAVDDFFADKRDEFRFDDSAGSLKVQKRFD